MFCSSMTALRSQSFFVVALSTSLVGCFTELRGPNFSEGGSDVTLDSWSPDADRFDSMTDEDAHEADSSDGAMSDRPTILLDVVDSMDTPSIACDGAEEVACSGVCVNIRTSIMHCGRCAMGCPMVQDGTAECTNGVCGVSCAVGFERLANTCVRAVAPRPISPLSFGDVTDLRPTFRWSLPAHYTGVELQLCRNRACDAGSVIETITPMANATSVRPVNSLAQRTVAYWRIRGRAGALSSSVWSPTWLFHVPARAPGVASMADTSFNPHFDYNGDGLDDIAVGARFGSGPAGLSLRGAGLVRIFAGVAGVAGANAPRVVQSLGGLTPNELFGDVVVALGDVNGDGFGDLLATARTATAALNTGAGLARLYLGSATGLVVGANGQAHQTFNGIAVDENFGVIAAGLGDVNRDGYADFAVGSVSQTQMTRGRVAVYYGSATGVDPMAAPLTLSGNMGEGFGSSVAGAGDVNGDGFADMIIGAEGFDQGGVTDIGKGSLYLGAAAALSPIPAAEFLGTAARDRLGFSSGSAGDINGDGYSDFVLASAEASRGGRSRTGIARAYLGSNDVQMIRMQLESEGATPNESFGYRAGSVGDLNGDGFGDVAYPSPTADRSGAPESGAVTIMLGGSLGLSNILRFEVVGAGSEYFGTMTARNTDCNGDGFTDLFVGALNSLNSTGRVYYYFGAAGNAAPARAGTLVGDAINDNFGSWVATLAPTIGHRFAVEFSRIEGSLL